MSKYFGMANTKFKQIGFKFNDETSDVLHLERSLVWCWNMDTSDSFEMWLLEKDGDQFDRSCEREYLVKNTTDIRIDVIFYD